VGVKTCLTHYGKNIEMQMNMAVIQHNIIFRKDKRLHVSAKLNGHHKACLKVDNHYSRNMEPSFFLSIMLC